VDEKSEALMPAPDHVARTLTEAPRELREQEDWLLNALDAVSDGFWVWTVQTGQVFFSSHWMNLLGYAPEDTQPTVEFFFSVVHPDDLGPVQRSIEDQLAGLLPVRKVEIRLRTKSGQYRWAYCRSKVVARAENGKPARLVGAITDITDHKLAIEALRTSEGRLRLALEAAGQGSWELDVEAMSASYSPEHAQMLGYAPGELDFQNRTDFEASLHPDDRDAVFAAFRAHLAGQTEKYSAEFRLRTKAGDWMWILSNGRVISHDAAGRPLRVIGTHMNINASKQADAALRASEARYRRAEHGVNDGLWEWNIKTGVDYRSPRWLEILGYQPGELPLHVDPFNDLVHPDDKAKVWACVDQHLKHGHPYDVEMRLRHKNGHYVWVQTRGRAEHGADGTPSLMAGSITDISARKRAEERLTQSSTLAGFGCWELDLTSRDLWWSAEQYQLNGIAPGTPVDQDLFLSLIHPDDREDFNKAFERLLRSDSSDLEYRIVRRTGDVRHIRGVAALVRDAHGNPRSVNGANMDVTSHVKQRRALQESEARLRQAQRIAQVGDWELNVRSGGLHWSDEVFRIFELDPTQFSASYETFLNSVHPDDRDMVDQAYTTSLRTREPYRIVHRLLMPDGRAKHVEEQCETNFAPDGTPLTSRGTVQDVTERIRHEGEIRSALKEKEVLLREIHHRVKNNLQVISSLLAMQEDLIVDPEARTALGESINRVRSMRLIHDRLYQSEVRTLVDFSDFVREMVAVLVRSYRANESCNVSINVVPCVLNVETAMPCGLILNELVSNALRHGMNNGAGDLDVDIHTEPAGGFVLTVRDSGHGLPPGFDIKKQSSLGLQLVASLVRQIKGTLVVGNEGGASIHVAFKELPHVDR
jgi:PAS domain S-box-containing protein